MQDFQEEITRLENTQEGRRASDAGSVQQGNTNTSCCGGAAGTVVEHQALFRVEVPNLQEWCACFVAEVEKERK